MERKDNADNNLSPNNLQGYVKDKQAICAFLNQELQHIETSVLEPFSAGSSRKQTCDVSLANRSIKVLHG